MNYPKTRWSIVRSLDARNTEARARAWTVLIEAYRPALNAYARNLIRKFGGGVLTQNDVDDLVSGFVASCYDKDSLSSADPDKGSFRNYVRVLMRKHVLSLLRRENAKKRRPEGGLSALHEAFQVADESADAADEVLAKEWADCTLTSALDAVRKRSERNADCIEAMIDTPDIDNDELALRLGLHPRQIPVVRHRARQMLKEAMWDLLEETVQDPDQLAEERRRLRPYLGTWTDDE